MIWQSDVASGCSGAPAAKSSQTMDGSRPRSTNFCPLPGDEFRLVQLQQDASSQRLSTRHTPQLVKLFVVFGVGGLDLNQHMVSTGHVENKIRGNLRKSSNDNLTF